jgi:PAS domain S-box-containing protein
MRRQFAPSLTLEGFDEQAVFRSIFAACPDAMLLVDAAGEIKIVNPAAEQLLGYTADEFAGMNVDQLVPDSVRPRHASHRAAYARAPRARPMGAQTDLVAKRKDGTEVVVEIALSPLQDHGLPFVVASIRDVGTYPRVQKALQRARYSDHLAQMGRLVVDERDTALLLERAPRIAADALLLEVALVLLLEKDKREFRVASGVGLLPGHAIGTRVPNTPDSLPGHLLVQPGPVVLPDYHAETRFEIPSYLPDAGMRSGIVVPLSDRGRTIGALVVHSPRVDSFGAEEVRFLESLCSMIATSLQRADTEEALNHAQRLESVGQLTGGIAHDFNNLLTVIQGNVQVLAESPEIVAAPHLQSLAGAATRASHRAAELTAKLLAFSRRQVLQPQPVQIPPMLESLCEMLRRTLDQRVRIELDIAAGCPQVLADPVQLESAVLNVAINARDAMPEGGTLAIRATTTDRLPDELAHELADPGQCEAGFVSIAISDTGTGMPDEVRERAFEPFFTTKAPGRGTGLGLSTVYGFVKQSRGTVSITSARGEGTTVTLHIPKHRPDGRASATAPDSLSHGTMPRGLRILLVEDDAAVREIARTVLGGFGAEVCSCSTAEDALGLLVPQAGFDLLLTDIALGPGLRGTELAHEAQRRVPGLAVLLASGYPAELIDADSTSPLDWELLAKPYSRAELEQSILAALGHARGQDAG